MVTIISYQSRINADEKEFFTLNLQGDVELLKSMKTGKFYATAKKASITCTFDEKTCKSLIGKTLDGDIVKVESEAYDFIIPANGETITLKHKYEYKPLVGQEDAVFN